MPALTHPGVYVDESAFPTYISATPGNAVACFVGVAPRGPIGPKIVNSWKQFTTLYGGFETQYPPSSLHLAVFGYFSAGGTSAVIIRAIRLDTQGPSTASASLDDQNSEGAQPSIEVQAANPGTWGNDVYVDILPGRVLDPLTSVPITFSIVVKYQGTAPINVVERWTDLSMVPGSTHLGQHNYALDLVNSTYNGSNFIRLVDLANDPGVLEPTPAPANNPAPTPSNVSTQLSGGDEGQPITFNDQYQALTQLDQYPNQPFVINMPGVTNVTDVGQVVSYAEQRTDGFVVIDPPAGMAPDGMVAYAQSPGIPASAQAAIYYPQVLIADPYSMNPGITRLMPPGGFVVGQYINTDITRGVQKAPAGLGASLNGVLGLEYTLTNQDQGDLNLANVNCLVAMSGYGVVIWGARTLSPYLITRYVSVERTIIYLATELVAMSRFAVFEPNDWVLWNQVTQILAQFLTQFWQSGGLSGKSASEAFYIICDQTNNTPLTIQQGVLNIEIGVALEFPAEFVVIKIGQWAGGQNVSVTTT